MQFLAAIKYFRIWLFMRFLLAIADLTHPLLKKKSQLAQLAVYVLYREVDRVTVKQAADACESSWSRGTCQVDDGIR